MAPILFHYNDVKCITKSRGQRERVKNISLKVSEEIYFHYLKMLIYKPKDKTDYIFAKVAYFELSSELSKKYLANPAYRSGKVKKLVLSFSNWKAEYINYLHSLYI